MTVVHNIDGQEHHWCYHIPDEEHALLLEAVQLWIEQAGGADFLAHIEDMQALKDILTQERWGPYSERMKGKTLGDLMASIRERTCSDCGQVDTHLGTCDKSVMRSGGSWVTP